MKRKSFLVNSVLTTTGLIITKNLFGKSTSKIYGHNEQIYRLDTEWGKLNPDKTPVNDCHEMIQDVKGRILLLTNETNNNIIIYNTNPWETKIYYFFGSCFGYVGKKDYLFFFKLFCH